MRTLWQDVHYTFRQLRRQPGFAFTAILTLALGLGATTAALAVIDSVLLRPLAMPHPERIVSVQQQLKGGNTDAVSAMKMDAVRTKARSLDAVASYESLPSAVTTPDGTHTVHFFWVSSDFFRVPGVPARLGRLLSAADAHASVAVVNDAFWRTTLHGNPHVVGSTVVLEGRPTTIIGVMPAGFTFPDRLQSEAVYVPLVLDAKGKDEHDFTSIPAVARLRPGATLATANAEAAALYAHAAPAKGDDDDGHLVLRPYREVVSGYEQPALLALLGACALLLVIACANAANLQIARSIERAPELTVRAALGASRGRLTQQIVVESLTVSLLGAASGLVLAEVLVHWLRNAYAAQFARFSELSLHPEVFAGCTLLAILTGVVVGLALARCALRATTSRVAAQSGRLTRRSRISSMLVAVEIALTCVLLTGAGLFLQTFRALQRAPLGFDPHHVTVMTLMPVNPQESVAALRQSYERLLQSLTALPGVEAAGGQTSIPFSTFNLSYSSTIRISGSAQNGKSDETELTVETPGYNGAMGVRLRAGRGLSPSDSGGSQPVCLVNEAFVRHFLAGRRVLGAAVEFPRDSTYEEDSRLIKTPVIIVGITPDELSGGDLTSPTVPLLTLASQQVAGGTHHERFLFGLAPQFAVRSTLPQAALERELRYALRTAAPDLAEAKIAPLDGAIDASLMQRHLALRLAGGFGIIALLLATIGIYGVLAYSVAQRTREIGIRMALGSSRAGAMRLIARQAAVMVLAGLVLGTAAAWPAGRAIRSFLFGVPAFDPAAIGAAALVLLAVCVVATAVPALRATQVDPIEALRTE